MVMNANSSQNLDFRCDLQQTVKGWFYGIFVKLKSNEIVLFVTFRCLRKNSVKTTHSQQFRWIFISRNFSSKWKQCTRWKNENSFSLKKNWLNQLHCLVISLLVKPLLSRNFCEKSAREFLQFPHCAMAACIILIFRY